MALLGSSARKPIQRYLCRSCGFRFSDSTAQLQVKLNIAGKRFKNPNPGQKYSDSVIFGSGFTVQKLADNLPLFRGEDVGSHTKPYASTVEKPLNALCLYNRERRVSATEGKAKNLGELESRKEQAAGATKPDHKTVKGLIAQYAYWLEVNDYYEDTRYLGLIGQLARLGANLLDPESVKEKIAKNKNWNNSTRLLAVCAYDIMAREILKIEWTAPKYKQEEFLPFIPEEKELDQLVAATRSRRMAAYLQTLKETFADPGEALRLPWIDLSTKNLTIV